MCDKTGLRGVSTSGACKLREMDNDLLINMLVDFLYDLNRRIEVTRTWQPRCRSTIVSE